MRHSLIAGWKKRVNTKRTIGLLGTSAWLTVGGSEFGRTPKVLFLLRGDETKAPKIGTLTGLERANRARKDLIYPAKRPLAD